LDVFQGPFTDYGWKIREGATDERTHPLVAKMHRSEMILRSEQNNVGSGQWTTYQDDIFVPAPTPSVQDLGTSAL